MKKTKQSKVMSELLTPSFLIKQGFKQDNNGTWCKCFETHYLELIVSNDSYFIL